MRLANYLEYVKLRLRAVRSLSNGASVVLASGRLLWHCYLAGFEFEEGMNEIISTSLHISVLTAKILATAKGAPMLF